MPNNYSLVTKTSIEGLIIIERPEFKDNRGFFREVFYMTDIKESTGIDFKPVRMSHSYSKPNVVRALHAEDMNKLVYPVTGEMFAAIVDIRPESKTFGKTEEFTFKESDSKTLFIPKGVANSICVSGKKSVHYVYLVDIYYNQGADTKAVAWDDKDINVKWPVKNPIISDRDKNNPTLREMYPEKFK